MFLLLHFARPQAAGVFATTRGFFIPTTYIHSSVLFFCCFFSTTSYVGDGRPLLLGVLFFDFERVTSPFFLIDFHREFITADPLPFCPMRCSQFFEGRLLAFSVFP